MRYHSQGSKRLDANRPQLWFRNYTMDYDAEYLYIIWPSGKYEYLNIYRGNAWIKGDKRSNLRDVLEMYGNFVGYL